MNKTLIQEHYPEIEIDLREKDIVQIWQDGDVIQIERYLIENLIEILKKEIEL